MKDGGDARLFPRGLRWSYLYAANTVFAIVLAAAWTSAAGEVVPAPITRLHAIRTLTKAEARRGLPVAFEGTVTYYNRGDVDLFVEDGGDAIYVETKPNQELALGDRVLVRGKTRESFGLDVLSDSVTMIRHGEPPAPVPADFNQLIRAHLDCMRVTSAGDRAQRRHSEFLESTRRFASLADRRRTD